MILDEWAHRHDVAHSALAELRALLGAVPPPPQSQSQLPEAIVSKAIRLQAAQLGIPLWRNNVGVLPDERGVPVRFGLANDTPAMNKQVKSHDLIGLRPVHITEAMVGSVIGQFISRESKAGYWKWRGTEREQAQMRFAEIVIAHGGDARFATDENVF